MNDKEFNLLVLQELKKVAVEVFASSEIGTGTYTAAELAKRKDSKGRCISIEFKDEKEAHTVSVGDFKCTFQSKRVFELVWRFENLAKVAAKDKARFTRDDEQEEVIYGFYMTITKGHTELAKLVSKDDMDMGLEYIYIDPYNSVLVSCNRYVMKEYPVAIESYGTIPEGMNMYIDPNHIKYMVGRCLVKYVKRGVRYATEISNEDFKQFTCDCFYRYQNHRSVHPKVSRDGHIKISKAELKPVSDFVKWVGKHNREGIVSLRTINGDCTAYLSCASCDGEKEGNREIAVGLESAAKIDIKIGLKASYVDLLLPGWTGGLWLSQPATLNEGGKAVVFDYNDANIGLAMPKFIKDYIAPTGLTCDIDAMDRLVERRAMDENVQTCIETGQHGGLVSGHDEISGADATAICLDNPSIVAGFSRHVSRVIVKCGCVNGHGRFGLIARPAASRMAFRSIGPPSVVAHSARVPSGISLPRTVGNPESRIRDGTSHGIIHRYRHLTNKNNNRTI